MERGKIGKIAGVTESPAAMLELDAYRKQRFA